MHSGDYMETWKSDLLKLARDSIMSWFSGKAPAFEIHPEWLKKQATFVTLTEKGELRGCIGSVHAFEELYKNVMRNAVNAAFHDPRFNPVEKHEMKNMQIEISRLSEPEILKKIRNKGVILEKNTRSVLFLPQVWEQLKSPEEFLKSLCWKAGLGKNCWKSANFRVFDVESIQE